MPDARFTIIPPGSTYDLAGVVAVPVRLKAAASIPGTVPSGNHVMTVEVSSWPFSLDAGKKLQGKWVNIGFLYYGATQSEPFEVSIPSVPELHDCSEPESGR